MNRRDVLAATRARMLLASGEARRIRERARASRSDIANAIGVKPSSVSHWENGIRSPRTATAVRYAELLAELADLAHAEDG